MMDRTTEVEIKEQAPRLTEEEADDVQRHRSLSAISVYTVVYAEGKEELARPLTSLWWSGVAAGLGISASVLAEGILHHVFLEHPYRHAIENIGYTVGFILVILARLQLFTENTITAILPLLTERTGRALWCTARLWAIVLVANLAGTAMTAYITPALGVTAPDYIEGMMAISHHYGHLSAWEGFARGIPAGFFVAALVWMLPSSKGSEIWTIFVFTYLIAMGDFTHVVAGSTELFMLIFAGEISIDHAVGLFLSTLAGNIVGGTGLFALLAYGQVVNELEHRP